MKYILNFSGGLCSWYAAWILTQRVSRKQITLLFADTNYESEELYRFSRDASEQLDIPITRISDGRTPWDVFDDEGFIGNTRVDICSRILKRELLNGWALRNFEQRNTKICVGLTNDEKERYLRFRSRMRSRGWMTEAPPMGWPGATKTDMLVQARSLGLEPSEVYEDGAQHDNCGGRCVKQGQGGWRRLLHRDRQAYLGVEAREEAFRARTGKNVAILRDRRGGTTKPLPLREFRARIEGGDTEGLTFEMGGCGCAIDESSSFINIEATA